MPFRGVWGDRQNAYFGSLANQKQGPRQMTDVQLRAILATHGFLIEQLFLLIFDLDPKGKQEAFRTVESSLLDIMKRSVADPSLETAEDVKVSDECEKQLKAFLVQLSYRMR
jgi:hypothetical protein